MSPVLLGRDGALAAVDDALATGGALRIVGEPGVGKTTVLAALRERAAARGARVLHAVASERGDPPFGLLAGALAPALAGDLAELVGDALAADLEGVRTPAVAPGLPEERHRVHTALRALLAALAVERPLVLALDDVQWADPASAEALDSLVRPPPGGAVLLALAHRSGHDGPDCPALLLDPLTRAEAEPLLAATAPAARDALFALAGGNPFYLTELGETGGAGAVPERLRGALERELAAVSPDARALAGGAAVAGDPCDLATAAAAAELSPQAAVPAVRELRGLCVGEDQLRFRHPVVRDAVYALWGPGRRLAAHARAAAQLERAGADAAAVAPHLDLSARPGDRAACAILHRAGLEAASGAPALAARWHTTELRLLREGGASAEEQLAAVLPLTAELVAAGSLDEALSVLRHALAEHAWPPVDLARLTILCVTTELLIGEVDAARQRLELAIDAVGDSATREAAQLKLALAEHAMHTGDSERFPPAALAALTASAGDPELTATALSVVALASTHQDDPAVRGAIPAAAGLVTDQLAALYYLGHARYFADDPEGADALFARALAVARRTGNGQYSVELVQGRALALLALGRVPEALAHAGDGLAAARLSGRAQPVYWSLGPYAWALHEAGEADRAEAAVREAAALARDGLSPIIIAGGASVRAAVLLEAGRPADAVAALMEGCGGPDLPLSGASIRCAHWALLAEADPDRGEDWARRAEGLAARIDLPQSTSHAQRARALVALAAGDRAAAHAAATRAAAAGGLAGLRARLVAATAATGTEPLAELTRDAIAAGALRLARDATRELRARGVAAAPVPSPALPGLTARQTEVARLLGHGAPNRAIAERLGLSERTVESHVAAICTRWELRTRAAIAARVAATSAGAA